MFKPKANFLQMDQIYDVGQGGKYTGHQRPHRQNAVILYFYAYSPHYQIEARVIFFSFFLKSNFPLN